MKIVNGKELKSMTSFTIPSNITKLENNCFAKCSQLTNIEALENIKEFGNSSLIYNLIWLCDII